MTYNVNTQEEYIKWLHVLLCRSVQRRDCDTLCYMLYVALLNN